ncbi:hypothetical protein COK86_19340 [Bacillus cereus]|uniref:Uncharacterized protein n=1 Tax=Bacillus cereus TaxID=1396 RepID=A0A2B3U0V5_BACCE|nr:hypothetical protein [Bacillus cereus]PFU40460.1 hypothetical protein COK86_19340 [Bacillus cereus]
MTVRKENRSNIVLIEPVEGSEEVLSHELIGVIRLNSNLHIGAFERRYSAYGDACKAMEALVEQGIFHAGTIRTYYIDGTVRLLGAWLYGADQNNGIGKQVASDMIRHIVADKVVGVFDTENLLGSEIAKEIMAGIIPK